MNFQGGMHQVWHNTTCFVESYLKLILVVRGRTTLIKRLILEISALKTLYSDQLTSTQLIKAD